MFGSLPRVPPQKCRFERPLAERRKTGTDPVKPLDAFRCRRLRHVRTISGNAALKLLPLRDHSAGGLAPVVAMALTPSHFDSKALNCTNDERDKLPRVRLSK